MSCISREKKFQLGNLEHWTVPRHTKSETHCTHNAFCSEYMGGKIQMPYIQMQEKASTWIDLTLSKEKQASLHYRDSKMEGKRDS